MQSEICLQILKQNSRRPEYHIMLYDATYLREIMA